MPVELLATEATAPATGWRGVITNALRYWEPRRLIYNVVLAAVVGWHWMDAKTASEVNYTHGSLWVLILMAAGANVCYCAAYVVDVFVQQSDFRALWLRWRWALFLAGTLAAAVMTHLFCGPFFHIPVR